MIYISCVKITNLYQIFYYQSASHRYCLKLQSKEVSDNLRAPAVNPPRIYAGKSRITCVPDDTGAIPLAVYTRCRSVALRKISSLARSQ